MELGNYIKPELLILIPVLYFIGMGLKKSALPDKWIPALIGAASIILSAAWVFATSDISVLKEAVYAAFTSITQGVLAAGASVYANQLYVQSKKEE